MRTALGAFAAVLMAGAINITPAHAQLSPQGSYLNSCTHVGMSGGRLFADCRRMDGRWESTSIDVDRCVGDIANIDGQLRCNRGAREGYGSSRWEERRSGPGAGCAGIFDPYERERCWRGW